LLRVGVAGGVGELLLPFKVEILNKLEDFTLEGEVFGLFSEQGGFVGLDFHG